MLTIVISPCYHNYKTWRRSNHIVFMTWFTPLLDYPLLTVNNVSRTDCRCRNNTKSARDLGESYFTKNVYIYQNCNIL